MKSRLTIEERIIQAIRRIIRANDLHSRTLTVRYRITGPQLMALREIARIPAATPTVIAHAVHVSQSTMTGILTRLARRGLVRRSRTGPDRRTTTLALTARGRRLLAASPPLLEAGFRHELEALQEWERTVLLAALQRISSMMGAEDRERAR